MKAKGFFCICAAAMLCCTACAGQSSGSESSVQESSAASSDGFTVNLAEGVDPRYGETLKKYFKAIESKDYNAYLETVYPPYAEAYGAYLESKGKTSEQSFDSLCKTFDEDGYESWKLTELNVDYFSYQSEFKQSDGISDFFSSYAKMGVFGEDFEQKCRDAAEDIRDVKFTLYALYSGDEEPVPVANGREIMMLIDKDGCWLFS